MASKLTRKFKLRVDTEDPHYRGMKKLKLTGKELMKMPDYVFTLIDLEVLDLSPERESCLYFKLYEVPAAIGRLANMKILMLDTNELRYIPREMCLLSKLERLALSNNNISSLPDEFNQLQSLKSLHVANNQFETIPLPVCQLQSLEFLDFSDNKLRLLPKQISKLQNLGCLYLAYNHIEMLPDSLCQMVNLRSLWLGGNNLRALPREFGRLIQLDWEYNTTSTSLDGNPLQSPPLEICKRGPTEISRYFAAAQKGTQKSPRGAIIRSNDNDDPKMENTNNTKSPTLR